MPNPRLSITDGKSSRPEKEHNERFLYSLNCTPFPKPRDDDERTRAPYTGPLMLYRVRSQHLNTNKLEKEKIKQLPQSTLLQNSQPSTLFQHASGFRLHGTMVHSSAKFSPARLRPALNSCHLSSAGVGSPSSPFRPRTLARMRAIVLCASVAASSSLGIIRGLIAASRRSLAS